MSKYTYPIGWKKCATCARWGGERKPADASLNNIEFDDSKTGKCFGGGFSNSDMSGSASCDKWEHQYKK